MRATQLQVENGLDYLVMRAQANDFTEEDMSELYISCRILAHQGYSVKKYLRFHQEVIEAGKRQQ